ncbi:hypothetical protein ACQEU6_04410 [Spirillospora sp. CA-108201]
MTWQMSALYAVAFGGDVAFSVYLPTYLKTQYGLSQSDAANRTAGFVLLAVVMRPIGGWLSDRVGAGSGATFALVAQLTPVSEVGAVTGAAGAAGGLGGFVPPLVMGFVYGACGSYAAGLVLLALVAAAAALFTATVVRRAALDRRAA